jgi:hypothetical protein
MVIGSALIPDMEDVEAVDIKDIKETLLRYSTFTLFCCCSYFVYFC